MAIELRPADPADAGELADLQIAAWHAAFTPLLPAETRVPERSELLAHRPGDGVMRTVARVDGRIAGFCTHGPSRDAGAGAEVGELRAIFVHPDHWGSGVGTALVSNVVESLRKAGYVEATLWSFRDNLRANFFYERHGFSPDGTTQRREVFGGTVEVRYRRPL